jgi:hypothetical protein
MARIQTSEALGKVLPDAVRVNAPNPQYNVDAATAFERAQIRNAERAASNAREMKGLANAISNFGAAIAEREQQDENYEIEKRMVDFDMQQDLRLDEAKRSVDGDPKDFSTTFMQGYDASAREFFKEVPDRLKPKVDQMLAARAARYQENATLWEREKSDAYHIDDLNQTLDTIISRNTQKAPEKFQEDIARGISVISSSKLSGEAKRKLKEAYAQKVEETAVRVRTSRGDDPIEIMRDLDRVPSWKGPESGPIDYKIPSRKRMTGAPRKEPIKGLVVHYTEGSDNIEGNTNWSNLTQTGANYYIDKEGGIYQWAPDEVYMNHAGIGRKTKDDARPDLTNQNTISVEIMTKKGEAPNEKQIMAARRLAAEKSREYGFRPEDIEGHGRLAPGHRKATEGVAVVDEIRKDWDGERWLSGDQELDDLTKPLDGQMEAPSFDFRAQPIVKNADGSVSTIRSFSIERDGREILLPSIAEDGRSFDVNTQEGRDAAVKEYESTGRHLGIYSGPDAATAAAERFHKLEERRVADSQVVYRHLSREQRETLKNIVSVAGRARIDEDIKGDTERIRMGGLEAVEPDKNGRFSIERAEGILTPNQIERHKIKMREADLEYRSIYAAENTRKEIVPIFDLTEREALNHIEGFLPNSEADDESFNAARRVQAKLENKWEKVKEARERDPAYAVDGYILEGRPAYKAPEVQKAHERIGETNPDGSRKYTAPQAWTMLIDARMAAQQRLGIRETKPITKREALNLLDMPDPSTMTEREFRDRLEAAREKTRAQFGDKWAVDVFQTAVGYIVGNQKERDIAAPVIRRMARGERVTQQDVRKSDDLRRASESDRLFPSPSDDAPPLTNRQGTTTPRAEANDKKVWPTPNERHIEALRKNRDPDVFDRKFGPGAAAQYIATRHKSTEERAREKAGKPAS